MNRVDLKDMYTLPASYNPPNAAQLSTNFVYPNLNSLEYRMKADDTAANSKNITKFHDIVDINDFGCIVLGCNNYTGRKWNGTFYGFENVQDYGVEQKAKYKKQCPSTLTNIRFVESNMVGNIVIGCFNHYF